ncbi:DUF2079 domain-containing protein [Kitasatospora sp. CB01950]|uniref:DUF2079 domain-containing protein n=1 Tax=Kitasatospora sp. CB01950 TaxID=1703930 RepID=UPI001F5234CC|nr:DUF2079 domain-containing protein [Kitasatospora sp. CB01950]
MSSSSVRLRGGDDGPPAGWRGVNWPRLLPWGLAAGFFVFYALFCLRRHGLLLTTGYDLGIFEQAVRGYAHVGMPVTPLKGDGFNLLGDHFSPILLALVPFYLVWPAAETLLLAQAALLALAVVPISRWAQRELGPAAAVAVAVGYGFSWGVGSTIGFDFHEVAFAAPLLSFSVVALAERRWVAAAAWAAPLCLVKEDLGITVAVIGGCIAWRGARRIGAATALFGLLATALELLVLLPAMSPSHAYNYWDNMESAPGAQPGLLERLLSVPGHLLTATVEGRLLFFLLVPTLLLAVRSPLLLVAVPTLAWRLLSKNPAYWGTNYHYSVVLMPIVFAAFVDVLIRLRAAKPHWGRWATAPFLCGSVAVTAVLFPLFPMASATDAGFWRSSAHVRTVQSVLADIPSGARVAAGNRLVPQLTGRCTVFEFGWPNDWRTAEWVVVDTRNPMGWPLNGAQETTEIARLRADGFRTVREDEGVLLLRAPSPDRP